MKKNVRRLLMALIFSATGFFGTVFWFNSGRGEQRARDVKPVARLNDATNEVERKPVQRVIWESVSRNDELYPGEAVRTAPNAEARLYFIKSGTLVHLDPDSLVVLEQNDKGLSLDFLQGNLFVQSSGNGGGENGLTLKTDGGEIKLKSADLSLSKAQNGNVNLEVHRGEAELAQGGKNTELNVQNSAVLSAHGVSVASDRMQMLKPQAGETVYLNLNRGEKLDLAWKPLARGYKVRVEVGKRRSALGVLNGIEATGDAGALSFVQKPGAWYLRLVATSNDPHQIPMASPVLPITIEPKTPPSLIEPRRDATVIKTPPDAPVAFKWVNRHKFETQVIEIAADAQFKNIKAHETLTSEATEYAAKLADGAYFWRVTGYLKIKDKREALTSPVETFAALSKLEVKPPVLVSPVNGTRLTYLDAQKNGVTLKWQLPKGVEDFKVSVEAKDGAGWKNLLGQDTQATQQHLTDLKPGTYRWTVTSIHPQGGANQTSAPFTFAIEDVQKIEWAKNSDAYEYHTPTPTLATRWKPLASEPATYRFRLAIDGEDLTGQPWRDSRQTAIEIPVGKDGAYQVQVEAVNAKGQLIAQSDPQTVTVRRQPLLPPPQWAHDLPPVLKSDGKGNLSLGWESVEGAENYLMILENAEGKVIDQRQVTRTTASLTRLKPGQYEVHLRTLDGFNRPSVDGDRRKIEVPNSSDIRAPRIKAMKVK